MERLTPEILKAAAKGLRHFATGFRTLSKIPALLLVAGDQTRPRNMSCESTEEPVPQVSDQTAQFFSEIAPPLPKEFLLSSFCKWGVGMPNEVLKFLLGENLRANRFHDQWIPHPSGKGWRTISEKDYHKIWDFVATFFQECKLLLTNAGTLQAFQENVGPVRASKWNRRNKMLGSKLDMSAFVKYAREMHKTLPSLK